MITRALRAAFTRTAFGDLARPLPFVHTLYRDHIWRGRQDGINSLWGVFDSEAEARAAAPSRVNAGWDTQGVHGELLAQPSVYASLFWISRHLKPGGRVIDLGGGFGTLYFDALRRGALPDGVRWQVMEVEALIAPARKRAAELNAPALEFVTAFSSDEPAPDVLVAAGYMQYVHHDLAGFFAQLPFAPERVVINKVALTSHPAFWTLQNLGASASPYRIYNRDDFVSEIDRCGYTIVDRWSVAEIQLGIPFHPRRRVQQLAGFYLERRP